MRVESPILVCRHGYWISESSDSAYAFDHFMKDWDVDPSSDRVSIVISDEYVRGAQRLSVKGDELLFYDMLFMTRTLRHETNYWYWWPEIVTED